MSDDLTVHGHLTAAINAFPGECQGPWELSVLNHIAAAITLDAERRPPTLQLELTDELHNRLRDAGIPPWRLRFAPHPTKSYRMLIELAPREERVA